MHIGIVGGLDRLEERLRTLAESQGHELEVHAGVASGPAFHRLKSMVERSDLLVIVTDVNSHFAVIQTRKLAKEAGRPVVLLRKLGVSKLRELLDPRLSSQTEHLHAA